MFYVERKEKEEKDAKNLSAAECEVGYVIVSGEYGAARRCLLEVYGGNKSIIILFDSR